ncbi:MAG: aminotransferase class I/II-fold pyridoxal phosphate-dependent enzyme [Planctomycetota bacterium]
MSQRPESNPRPSERSHDLFQKCRGFTRAREIEAQGVYPYFLPISANHGTEVEVHGRRLVMAGSNNYLGLTHHPAVLAAAHAALDRYGSSCSGSRFLNGTLELHVELERRLARFLDREAALCFSTGFQTNLGVISCLGGRDDVILTDRDNHASILDGCRLSFAAIKKFKHNDLADLDKHLQAATKEGHRGKLVVVDGVYSMMGDLADLPGICALARRHGARVLVDEAHAVGVLGENGRGTAERLGVEAHVDLVVGTFSKSFASLGGFVAGDEDVVHFIKHHARALMFSAAIHPAATAAALAALDVIENEPELRVRVQDNADYVRRNLRVMGFETVDAQTPIVPVIIGDQDGMLRFWKALVEEGVFTNPVTGPAVPPGMDLIRTSYIATHTRAHLDTVLRAFRTAGLREGVTPSANGDGGRAGEASA